MNLVFPSKDHGVIPTPLEVFWWCLYPGLIFTERVLKVTADDPDFSIVCVQGNKSTIGLDAEVPECSSFEASVFAFDSVYHKDATANGQ